MSAKFQLVFDCADPALLTRFWAFALGYVIEPPPPGFTCWNDYWRSVGVPEDEIDPEVDGADSIVDPDGVGPRIWFQIVPEGKVVKNRLHLDVPASGGRSVPIDLRRERVAAKADELVAAGATRVRVLSTAGQDHYGEVLQDPEGNEFCVH
jgi:hypothetical protein